MLRAGFRKEIDETLAKAPGRVYATDFVVTEAGGPGNAEQQLTITYRYNEDYMFNAKYSMSRSRTPDGDEDFAFLCTMRPGEMITLESRRVFGPAKLIQAIRSWAALISDELGALPANRVIQEQRRQIEAIIAEIGEMPDGYFSRDEAEALDQRLRDLETRMGENLKASIQDQARLRTKLAELERDFVAMRAEVNELPKKGWFKSVAVRAARWMRDPENRALLKSGVDVAKMLTSGDDGIPKV